MKLQELERNETVADFTIDLTYLREFSQGDPEFEKDILESSIKDAEEKMKLLRHHFLKKDVDQIKRLSHSLKSIMSVVGANCIEEFFSKIEHCAEFDLCYLFRTQFRTIEDLWGKAKFQIKNAILQCKLTC